MRPVIVYGEFTCPLSRLANQRADALQRQGQRVEWRAVRTGGERRYRSSPLIRHAGATVDTSLANAALASIEVDDSDRFRRALFRAHWAFGRDLGDPQVLADLGGTVTPEGRTLADHLQRMWEGIAFPVVPLVRLPTGYVYRGMDAVDVLTDLTVGSTNGQGVGATDGHLRG